MANVMISTGRNRRVLDSIDLVVSRAAIDYDNKGRGTFYLDIQYAGDIGNSVVTMRFDGDFPPLQKGDEVRVYHGTPGSYNVAGLQKLVEGQPVMDINLEPGKYSFVREEDTRLYIPAPDIALAVGLAGN